MAYNQYAHPPQRGGPPRKPAPRQPPPQQRPPPQQGYQDQYQGQGDWYGYDQNYQQGYEGWNEGYGYDQGYDYGYQDQYYDQGWAGYDQRAPPQPAQRGAPRAPPAPRGRGGRPPPQQGRPPPRDPYAQDPSRGRGHPPPSRGRGDRPPPQANRQQDGYGYDYGYDQGYNQGWDQNYGQGYDQGWDQYGQGYDQGYDQGYQQNRAPPNRHPSDQSRGQRPQLQQRPSQRSHQSPSAEAQNYENGMANMSLNDRPRPSGESARSQSSARRKPAPGQGGQGYDWNDPNARQYGAPQRSQTMPNEPPPHHGSWPENPVPGQRPPPGPQRPNTAGGHRGPPQGRSNTPAYGAHQYPGGRTRDQQIEEEMPNFDSAPSADGNHRRGQTIDQHLESPLDGAFPAGAPQLPPMPGPAPTGPLPHGPYGQGGPKSARSQPDLRLKTGHPEDAPPMPPMGGPRPMANGMPPPNRGTPGPQGPMNGYPQQGYPPRGQTPYGSSPAGQSPMQRAGPSFGSQRSDPGPEARGNMAANGLPRGPQGPGQHTSPPPPSMSPDTLPQHPTPVRMGLMDQQAPTSSPASGLGNGPRPAPVRQYNNPTPPSQPASTAPATNAAPRPGAPPGAPPVTQEELGSLRGRTASNKQDFDTALTLVKKLVEASVVLADDGGRADSKMRAKNAEKFVMEAHKLLKKTSQAGHTESMFYLADCYGTGQLGFANDAKEAFALYQSAAKAGHATAAYRTAVCCEIGSEDGGGTRKDPLKAVQWYKRAAMLGDVPAMYKVGMIMLKGLLGQTRNPAEAVNWLKRAADRADEDNPHALHELGLIYESAGGNDRVVRDESYSLSLFQQAADLGYKYSQFRLAQAYEFGSLGAPIEPRASIAWYSKAAAQDEHQSELALSGWYLTGASGILEQSDTEAFLWARKAASASPPLAKALFAMGYYSEVGIGCARSLEEAKKWYGRAAAYKYPKAQERLDALRKGGAKAQKGRERLSRSNPQKNENECSIM